MSLVRRVRVALVAAVLAASAAQAGTPALPGEQAQWLSSISADAMRGHLSFLASDALEGRGTPSRGLDIAAEYIAAQFRAAAVTGADYSDVGEVLRKAGELTGTRITRHPVNSDRYFAHSDNQALADLGVPAHTVSVAYAFPDYHGAADTWDKIDYDNMAAINRTVALALLTIANDPQAPRWNAANPKTAKYVEAARKLKP